MKATELREKTPAELQELLFEFLKEQFEYRMQLASGQFTKHTQLRAAKKNVARVKTILAEKSRAE